MGSERLSFPNGRGQMLAGYLESPEGSAPRAYGVFAHCFTCSKDYKAVYHVSRTLAENGIAVLRFDFTGLGESEGDFSQTSFSTNVDDLRAAARFLKERFAAPRVLLGHSLGAAAVLHAAAELGSCRAVATIAAPFDPAGRDFLAEAREEAARTGRAQVEIGGRPFSLERLFFEDLDRIRVPELLGRLGKPVLFFHSPTDEITPFANGLRLFEAAREPKSFVTVDGADHLLSDREDARFVGQIAAAWMRRYSG